MHIAFFRWTLFYLAFFSAIYLPFAVITHSITIPSWITTTELQTFKTFFISIILEALPFVLLGVVLSSVLQIFVSERTIQRWVPRHPVAGVLFACILGLFFPVCECGLIPVVRRLIHKGMPAYVGTTFILAGPVLNPVVYAATYMAFRTNPIIAYSRMGLAFLVACGVGLTIYRFVKHNPLKTSAEKPHADKHEHSHEHSHGHSHEHSHEHRPGNKLFAMFTHAGDEFFEMGKFLMLGSFLTALIQTFVSRESLIAIGQGSMSSHLFMMGFAYILSLCSTSDAFVASSFLNTFSKGSLLAFLVFGPMLDIKSTMMLFATFKTKFVLLFCGLIVVFVLVGSLAFGRWILT